MLYSLFAYSLISILFSLSSVASPIPLSFKKKQSQLWDIKHNIFSQNDKIGHWRQKLKFNTKTKTFLLNNYSRHTENLGAQKIEAILTAKSNVHLEPVSYNYTLKINNKIIKTISAKFYKKWTQTRLKPLSKKYTKKYIKKRKVRNFKNTNELWITAKVTDYKNNKPQNSIVEKPLPAPLFLSSFLSLVLSQKMVNNFSQKNFKSTKKNFNQSANPVLNKSLSFLSFSEETLKLETGVAKLISKNNKQFTWQAQYKNYSFSTTMDKKGKLLTTSIPLRQLRSQIIRL